MKPSKPPSDAKPVFRHGHYQQARTRLRAALHAQSTPIVLTGAPGVGKTTLLDDVVSNASPDDLYVVNVRSTHLHGEQLLRHVAEALGDGERHSRSAGVSVLEQVGDLLDVRRSMGIGVLLSIDEAHALPRAAWMRLDALLTVGGSGAPALKVVLAGLHPGEQTAVMSPESRRRLSRPTAKLLPLDPFESRPFVEHQLSAAGWTGNPCFSADVYRIAHAASAGVPALLNRIFSRLMLYGVAHGRRHITGHDLLDVLDGLGTDGVAVGQLALHEPA